VDANVGIFEEKCQLKYKIAILFRITLKTYQSALKLARKAEYF
jgi:hypothetical protein